MFKSINPFNLDIINEYALQTDAELEQVLLNVEQAQITWGKTNYQYRADKFLKVATLLEKNTESLAELMALEMGKPLAQGVGEINKCALVCRYYAEHAESFMKDKPLVAEGKTAYVHYQALGTIFTIMPWNFPFWQVFRCVAPTMMMGNTVILKHAENVTGCALAIETLMLEAGFDANTFKTVVINNQQAKYAIQHSSIKAVSLTGSTQAGRSVAQSAGEVLKKCVLELGGNDAYCVLDDADIQQAAQACVTSRFLNSGQICIAAKRWIVSDTIYDEFIAACIELVKQQVIGNPLHADTTMGPLARIDLRNTLQEQLNEGLKQDANILYQSDTSIINNQSAFFPATIIDNIDANNSINKHELFGPVACVYKTHNDSEMLSLANNSEYGLGAAVFTQDADKAHHFAKQLEAGCVAINSFVASHPAIPFGGIKQSGYGRELAREGLLEFVNMKSIVA